MSLRYLFGPVNTIFAEQNLRVQRSNGACLTFGSEEGVDLVIRPTDSWQQIRQVLPTGWEPDFIVLTPAYGSIPRYLWGLPLPRVALAADWNLSWHLHRMRLRQCDLILSDALGVEVLQREGIEARTGNLCGCERLFVEHDDSPSLLHRDIDVLFVGNLNPAVQAQRAPWLTRVANLGQRWRVQIRSGVFGEEYRRLLKRTRIVFQFSSRGKLGRRAFEAANCGALIFQEAGNRELPAYFRDREECVYYDDDSFEELVGHFLEHEDERIRLADAARLRARAYTFQELWQKQVEQVEQDWAALRDRAGRPNFSDVTQELTARCWEGLTSIRSEDAGLVADLEKTLQAAPENALVANLLGCVIWQRGRGRAPAGVVGKMATDFFRRAFASHPEFCLAGLNWAQSLDATGKRNEAVQAAKQTLAQLYRHKELDPLSGDGIPLCRGYDFLHVQWEKAAWQTAGKPRQEAQSKRNLLLWQLHGLLEGWTGELHHACEALLRNPEVPISHAGLGQALSRAGQQHEAVEHLRDALARNPLDRPTASALFQTLGSVQDSEGRRLLCEERRLLAQAAPQIIPAENWFAEPRAKSNELVSIIVLCGDDVETTKRCLDRLARHGRTPYEWILVQNGGDIQAMKQLRQHRGPARVEVVSQPSKRRFAQACNLALTKARGGYVAFLDDSMLVTPGWLDCLIALALHDWPQAGLVGGATNGWGSQAIAIDFAEDGIDQVDGFAARRRRAWAGQMAHVNRLASPCLARREVLGRLGDFDEVFETASFAVCDLGLRVREAGLKLLLAQDVYIHRLAAPMANADAAALDTERRDFELLQMKWGPQLTVGHEPLDRAHLGTAIPRKFEPSDDGALQSRQGVSLCMIVRDEEANLPECLRTIQGLFDEVIVVDTGSTDRTREAAHSFGAKVFEFPWVDSFGDARNESVRHATGKWIMWLDADDRFDDENRERLRKVLASLGEERDAYAIKVRSVLDADRTSFRLLDQVRIFRNLPEIRWEYRIHEQILPAVNRAGGTVRWTDVVVDHVGYQDATVRQRKLQRNLRLLHLDDADRSDDSFTLFNLGWTLLDLGKLGEALPRLKRSLETAKPDSSILRKLYHLLAIATRLSGDSEESLRYCREGLKRFADDAELLLEYGLMLRDRGDLLGAESHWSRLLEPRQGKFFTSEDVGLRGFRTRQLLAEIFVRQERWTEAEIQWRSALEERGDFEPAWMGLADLLLRSARWTEFADFVQNLEDCRVSPPKVGWLKARSYVQRKEFAAAQKTLAQVIPLDPVAIGPRVLRAQAYINEGRDWPAAEKALLDVLEIDPDNKDAKHNLELLRQLHAGALSSVAS